MQELVGRLTALDPEASETLKVIAYFDALVLAGASMDALVRGAAALSGTIAGAERRGRVSRRTPDGKAAPESGTLPRTAEHECVDGAVWLEREGKPHANDDMVVERLALALDLLEARRNPVGDLEVALDPDRPLDERTTALARLRITPTSRIRVIASYPDTREPQSPLSIVLPSRYGIVRATLVKSEPETPPSPAGIGLWVSADHAPDSWDSALVALRMTEKKRPVVDATDLGALLVLAHAHDPAAPHDDVRALARLDERTTQILQVLVEADSLRSAATILGMHHSSLQARQESLTQELGYDPRTIGGRMRYGTAEFLRRLADPRALR